MVYKRSSQNVQSQLFRFNQGNIEETKAIAKEYGVMKVCASKTPYHRPSNPVKAKELKDRLNEALGRPLFDLTSSRNSRIIASSSESESNSRTIDSSSESVFDFYIRPERTDPSNMSIKGRERRHLDFIKKRKILTQSEFLITRQKFLSGRAHPPGPSIGHNWRIEEKHDSLNTPRLSSILSPEYWPISEDALRFLLQQTASIHSGF